MPAWVRRPLVSALLLAAFLSAAALAWRIADALAAVFMTVLLGASLHGAGDWLSRRAGMTHRRAVTVVLLASLLFAAGALWLTGVQLGRQVSQLAEVLPESLRRLRDYAAGAPWLARLSRHAMARAGEVPVGQAVAGAGGVLSSAMEAGVTAALVLFGGVFLAYEPDYYLRGTLGFVPEARRPRAERVLRRALTSLWLWTLGRFLVMTAVGVSHTLLYWAMGLPSPLALGLISGTLSFIPNLGPTLATVPAALAALSKDPKLALWVLLAHAVLQTAEGNLLTPVVQRELMDVPPFVSVAALLVFGSAMGVTGLVIATPAAAALQVLVEELRGP